MEKNKPFDFGKNWKNFLKDINDKRIQDSERSLKSFIGFENFSDLKFLDVGSGSGLSSLAANRLGATVHSFDYDLHSVEATKLLRNKFLKNNRLWTVENGSVLDFEYLKNLGQFDIVYSWGVFHHTGNMKGALKNIDINVKSGGYLFIALYNDQGFKSKVWKKIKKLYVSKMILRPFLIAFGYLIFLPKK